MAIPGPLTDKDLKDIDEHLKNLDEAELELGRAIRAGIEVTDQAERIRDARTRLKKIKSAYFPGR